MAEDEQPGWTVDVFRPFVKSILDEWKQDLLYVQTGLVSSDNILKDDEMAPGKDAKDHPYNQIFLLIIKKIAGEFKLDKKSKKTMVLALRSFHTEWEAMIRAKQIQSPLKKKESSAQDAVENEYHSKESENKKELEVNKESKEADVEGGLIELPDQNVVKFDVDLSPKQLQMKEEFEKSKQEVLDSLPKEVKSRFGQQYFSKWGKSSLPCLVLSPYNVPPGGVRSMWFDMYEKVKKQGRLGSASNLVYWYGAYDDPQNAYSFVVTSKLTTYATGEKKNFTRVPNAIQKKLDNKKKLSGAEKMLVEGLAEMEEDRVKEPDERHGRMIQAFLEDWEFPEEKEESIEKEQVEEKPKAKSKPKKLKKRKKEDETEPKLKKQKKSKKTEEPKGTIEEKKPTEKKLEPKKDETGVAATKVEGIEDIGDDDVSSHEDKDDLEDVEPPTESDEDDEDFEYEKEDKKPKNVKKKPARKVAPKKKAKKTKIKLEKGRKEGKKKVAEGENKRNKEKYKFKDCETRYLSIIDDWKYGLENHSKGTIKEIYVRLLDCVADFSAPFIEAYEMPALMKRSKRIVDDDNRLKLWKTMKDVYQTKKKDVPAGFVPQKKDRKLDAPKREADEKRKKLSPVGELAENGKPTMKPKTKVATQDPPSTPKKTANSAATTEKKRGFSLGSMMTKPKSTSKPQSTSGIIRSASSSQLSKRQNNPQWISETSIKDAPKDENRAFALEFLQQATPFIPPNDKVNADVIARELEASIFEWAGGKEDVAVEDCFVKYWDKVDDMVAAISGDGGHGTIARMISQGRFQAASDVVGLSENDIACSYEGRPLEDFKFV